MIALIGPGGAGKTTVGILLAERLGETFVDLDRTPIRHEQRRSANESQAVAFPGISRLHASDPHSLYLAKHNRDVGA
jgi:hypothetical protein